eukprot:tig00021312_g20082.t1
MLAQGLTLSDAFSALSAPDPINVRDSISDLARGPLPGEEPETFGESIGALARGPSNEEEPEGTGDIFASLSAGPRKEETRVSAEEESLARRAGVDVMGAGLAGGMGSTGGSTAPTELAREAPA